MQLFKISKHVVSNRFFSLKFLWKATVIYNVLFTAASPAQISEGKLVGRLTLKGPIHPQQRDSTQGVQVSSCIPTIETDFHDAIKFGKYTDIHTIETLIFCHNQRKLSVIECPLSTRTSYKVLHKCLKDM